jgi:hypothetical protein
VAGTEERLADEINRNGRPVLALIEDRPGAFHYIVVVGAPERGIVFHDPARSSYRVMPRDEFAARWRASERWMAIVTPRADTAATVVPVAGPATLVNDRSLTNASPCDSLVAEGVRQSQAGDFAGAERTLTSALACPGGAAYRELAGLRVLQKRWSDAASLADTATQADARDAYAWRLLATARFLQDNPPAALAALNQAGEPAVDSVQVSGLQRTRAKVIEDAIDVDNGELLTPGMLDRARRRLKEVPSIRATALEFVPVSGGRAEVRATVTERRLFPIGAADLGEIAFRSIFQQDPRASIGSMTGNGERLDLQYRFRRERPRLGATLSAPAPWGGVWSVQGIWERQPFDTPEVPTSERTTGRVTWTDWTSGRFQVSARGGFDRWLDIGSRGMVGGTVFATTLDDRISVRLDVDTWMGDTDFSSAKTIAKYSSSNRREGFVFVSSAGAGVASDALPTESWFAGDSGAARPGPVPLRAHGLIQDSRYFRTDQMGRTIVHGSGEGQYWFRVLQPPPAAPADAKPEDVKPTGVGGLAGPGGIAALRENLRLGVAAFVDSARVMRRLSPGDRNDVDIGGGLRISVGGRGSIRVDYGHGLINADNKFSFGYEL